ncbi:MAG: SGNH/GDSL hydrolase family protein [Bacteroides sp.]|nr:SGNH/GDSL hydrolase family protein [Bacteroides sp.]
MKTVYLLVIGLLMNSMYVLAQDNQPDWPNLNKYREANAAVAPKAAGEQRVVFMGNSITEGWVKFRPSFFEGCSYIGRGISGQTTPQMLIRFRQDVVNLDPDVVVILAGTNDIAGNTGPASLEMILDNLMSMCEIARANGIRVVLCSVLPAYDYPWRKGLEPADKIPALNAMIREYADRHQIVYVDYFTAMADERNGLKEEYTYDGVHPDEQGYMVMEPIVEEGIRKALQQEK